MPPVIGCGHAAVTAQPTTSVAKASPFGDVSVIERVRSRLSLERGLDARRIEINAHRGIVTLRGEARTGDDAARATRVARLTRGVRAVISHLRAPDVAFPDGSLAGEVRDELHRSAQLDPNGVRVRVVDGKLRREIETEIQRDSRVDASKVQLSVDHGTATVAGTVADWQAYNAVLEHVFEALPSAVVNHLNKRESPRLLYSH
jgi:osmotically-inducible protein OsmY